MAGGDCMATEPAPASCPLCSVFARFAEGRQTLAPGPADGMLGASYGWNAA